MAEKKSRVDRKFKLYNEVKNIMTLDLRLLELVFCKKQYFYWCKIQIFFEDIVRSRFIMCLCDLQDCFNRPISSSPDAWFDLVERVSNDNNKTLK